MHVERLYTRQDWTEEILKRDDHKCVICGHSAVDVHHIIDRKLWEDGGYYLSNGASLCSDDHLRAEYTILSCDELRKASGISVVMMPERFVVGDEIDKWGNIILPNKQRLRGELFYDDETQAALKLGGVLSDFAKYVKYPRTPHLPWSGEMSADDIRAVTMKHFEGQNVIITTKMDGESTTIYNDYVHARSVTFNPHPARSSVRQLQAILSNDIPDGWRVVVENLHGQHTISNRNVLSFFPITSIWNERNISLPWSEVVQWGQLLNLPTVPVLYEGVWDEAIVRGICAKIDSDRVEEGCVVRLASEIPYRQFGKSVAKYVSVKFRTSLDNAREHWSLGSIIYNTKDPESTYY